VFIATSIIVILWISRVSLADYRSILFFGSWLIRITCASILHRLSAANENDTRGSTAWQMVLGSSNQRTLFEA
jgi:hypothetical protein